MMDQGSVTAERTVLPALDGAMRRAEASVDWRVLMAWGGVILAWSVAIWMLWPHWALNENYEYGKVVPLLAGYLFLERWRSRPVASLVPLRGGVRFAWALLAGLGGAIMGLALFLHEANPEWRLLSWMGTLAATGLSVLLLQASGGGRWVRHFAFPIFLFWLAVPWPRPWETRLMQHLMQTNAYLAAELVRWAGVEAVATGNVIRLTGGAVGVEEACSGIRSLYGSLMVGVFLGEWFSLTVARRIWLAFAAVVLALVTNLGRSVLLVGMADSRGIKAMEIWHDTVGYLFMALCLAGIAAVGWMLKTRKKESKTGRQHLPSSAEARPQATRQAVSAGVFATMLLAAVLGIRLWFGGAASATEKTSGGWAVEFPKNAPAFSRVPVSRAVESMLHFDYGESAHWSDAQSRHWAGFYFRWDAGRSSYHDLFVHDPTVCMSGLGMTLERDLGLATGLTSGDAMPVHEYVFKDAGADVYVFNCLAEDGVAFGGVDDGGLTWANRWRAAVQARSNGIKRRLELAVWGLHNDAEARAAFQDFLSSCWHDQRVAPTPGHP